MQNNIYGAELDLKIDKFKSKMKEAQNISKETGKKIADNTKYGVWKDGIYTLSNGMQFVKKEEKQLNNEIEKTGKVTLNTGNEISKAFNKGLKSVKKLTVGFLGARTAFGLFKKYMGQYSSENDVFAEKMRLTSSVIANTLAPAFEFFGNVIQYAVIGLARIIELLTGVNILGKTVDNSLKGASKSAKELNDNLSGLDEISNIDKEAGGLSTGISSQIEAMNDFKKKIEEVDAWFKKHKIDEKILAIKNAVKSVWNWMTDHPILTTAFVAGLIALKTGIIPSLVSALSGSGSTSLLGGFKALLAVGLTVWVIDQVNALNDLENKVIEVEERLRKASGEKETKSNEKTSYMKEFNDYNEQDYKQAKKDYEDAIKELEKANKEDKKLVNALTWIVTPAKYYSAKERIEENNRRIARLKEEIQQLNVTYDIGTDSIGKSVQLTDTMQENLEKANKRAKFINDNTFEWQGNIQNANEKTSNLVGTFSTGFNNIQSNIKDTNNTYDEFKYDIYDTFNKNYKLNIKTDDSAIDSTKTKIDNTFKNPVKIKFTAVASGALSKMAGLAGNVLKDLGIGSYDVGTDYVPRDQIAMIHEGERIIPKKYNNSNSLNNEETNSLLIELNKNVLELANKPSILNVNGRELAKATYSDFKDEESRRGNNISVRRV